MKKKTWRFLFLIKWYHVQPIYSLCICLFISTVKFIAVRPDAKTDGSKPISGGLSHCWPQVCTL